MTSNGSCCTLSRFTKTQLRPSGLVALTVLALAIFFVPQAAMAQGCQASGSIPLFPLSGNSCPAGLLPGDTLDIAVTFSNSSSTVPPGTNVPAVLTGTIVVTLPAGDTFLDGGTNGCVSHVAGVASCTAGASAVNVNMTAGGVSLAAGASLATIATVRTTIGGPAAPGCTVRSLLPPELCTDSA